MKSKLSLEFKGYIGTLILLYHITKIRNTMRKQIENKFLTNFIFLKNAKSKIFILSKQLTNEFMHYEKNFKTYVKKCCERSLKLGEKKIVLTRNF